MLLNLKYSEQVKRKANNYMAVTSVGVSTSTKPDRIWKVPTVFLNIVTNCRKEHISGFYQNVNTGPDPVSLLCFFTVIESVKI